MSDQAISAPAQSTAIQVPDYLRLHWLVVFLLCSMVGGCAFGAGTAIWLLLQAQWVRKVTGDTRAYKSIVGCLLFSAVGMVIFYLTKIGGPATGSVHQLLNGIGGLLLLTVSIIEVVLYFVAVFDLRSELRSSPFGMSLGPFMTFFFGPIYFQYHFNKWGLPGEVGGPPGSAMVTPPPSTPPVQS